MYTFVLFYNVAVKSLAYDPLSYNVVFDVCYAVQYAILYVS